MNKAEFINKLRMYLADKESRIWSDDELNHFIDEAIKKYSADSKAFTAHVDFAPDKNGRYVLPDDCAGIMVSWNDKGETIIPSSGNEIYLRSMKNACNQGSAEYIFNDYSNHNGIAFSPDPAESQDVVIYKHDSASGEVVTDEYGVLLDNQYGVSTEIKSFNYAGVIYYNRTARCEEIRDYMAVIYYALSLAYSVDTELSNQETALFWQTQYQQRVCAFGRILKLNSGTSSTGNFY